MAKRPSYVLAIASQKGGAGKTTLAAHLAVAAEAAGHGPVALVDVDPQGSLATWWNQREAESPQYFPVNIDALANDLGQIQAQGFSMIIIDTPPAITNPLDRVIAVADLVLVPTRPSPLDIWAIGSTINRARQGGFLFVLNAAKPSALLTAQTGAALSEHGVVSKVIVGDRIGFASSMTDGRTLQELTPRHPGALEIHRLWGDVHSRLQKVKKGK